MYECTGNAPSDWILTKIATVYPAINCVFFFFFFFWLRSAFYGFSVASL